MSKDLGYKPAKGPDGSGNYSHKQGSVSGTGTSNNHARSKKRQDGVNGDKGSLNAGDHLYEEDGAVNGNPEDC